MTDAIYGVHAAVNEAFAAAGDVEMDEEATEETELIESEGNVRDSSVDASVDASVNANASVGGKSVDASGNSVNLPPQLVKEQIKYCQRILRGLKRHREAGPFLLPVDPVALNIPDYFTVIKCPMDLSAITKKCDLNEYASADAFIGDVRLMLTNCFTYNAPESQVTKMGRNLEKYFNTAMSKLPTELGSVSAGGSASSLPSVAVAAEQPSLARPKRESVSVPSSSAVVGVGGAVPRRGSSVSAATLSFCSSVLRELMKKANAHLNWPFMIPVDPVALNIPDYFEVVKQPMDLSTIRKKLDTGMYTRPEQFEADVRLVFANCYAYNPPESDITKMAHELESVFDQKMAQKPAPKPQSAHVPSSTPAPVSQSTSSSMASLPHAGSFIPSSASQLIPGLDALEDDSEKILAINHQIQILQAELNYLLINRKSSSSTSLGSKSVSSGNSAAPSKPKKKAPASSSSASGSTLKSAVPVPAAFEEMTFEEKRQLSEDVSNLAQENMMRVLEIIQEYMPNLHSNGDSDVIELDIEALDVRTLRALQTYIWECHNPGKKRKPSTVPKPAVKKTKDESESAANTPANNGSYDSSSSSSSEDDD